MKKRMKLAALLLAAVMVSLCGCSKSTGSEPTAAPTQPVSQTVEETTGTTTESPAESAPTEPEWEPGVLRLGPVGLVWQLFHRDDGVTVLGQWGEYYVIQGEAWDLLVDSRYLRLSTEEAPKADSGFSQDKTPVYATAAMEGEPLAKLKLNTLLQVLDRHADWALVEWAEGTGYIRSDRMSPWQITADWGSGSNGSSGGNGGSSGSGGQDGSDVDLGGLSSGDSRGAQVVLLGSYCGPEYEAFEAPVEGRILSPETPGCLCLMNRGDEVKVTEVTDGTCTVYVQETFATLPRWAVRLSGEDIPEAWTGYARWDAKAFASWQLREELDRFGVNEKVRILEEIPELGVYVVDLAGTTAYMSLEEVSAAPYAAGGFGGSGSENGSSGSSTGGDWTPPVL